MHGRHHRTIVSWFSGEFRCLEVPLLHFAVYACSYALLKVTRGSRGPEALEYGRCSRMYIDVAVWPWLGYHLPRR